MLGIFPKVRLSLLIRHRLKSGPSAVAIGRPKWRALGLNRLGRLLLQGKLVPKLTLGRILTLSIRNGPNLLS